jgi:hypothetical protein
MPRQNKRAAQELLKLDAQLPRLKADEERARLTLQDAERALDSLDGSAYNGFVSRKLATARDDVRSAAQWHKRALADLEKCQRRRERLVLLSP